MRLTVQRRSWDVFTARGRIARARSAPSSSGKATLKVTRRFAMRLPCSSLILSPVTATENSAGSACRPVATSTSAAEQPPMAASSSSTGVNSAPPSVLNVIVPPRGLVAT